MSTDIRIHPRVRAYGNSRIEITRRAQDEREWQNLWREPLNPFPFKWGSTWKQCVEYRVDDFASEVGFFIDVLGLSVSTFSPTYAQFTSPDQEFTFAISAVTEGELGTPPDAFRLQFHVDYLMDTILELEGRGIFFENHPKGEQDSSAIAIACFRSPHGIPIDLVGEMILDDELSDEAEYNIMDLNEEILEEDLEDVEIDDDLGADERFGVLESEEEEQGLDEEEESTRDELEDEATSDLPSWTSLLTRQEHRRSASVKSQAYPRPSDVSSFRFPSHDTSTRGSTRKDSSDGELTYSELDDDEPVYGE